MKMTIEIKLMNRVKPVGMEQYKKMWKPPVRLRGSGSEHLNKFQSEITGPYQDFQARNVWGNEISRLMNLVPWKIQQNPDFGDMLIGCISCVEFDDFYTEIYLPVKPIK